MFRIKGHFRSLVQPGGRISQPWISVPSKLWKVNSSGEKTRKDRISESLCALKRRKGKRLPAPAQTSLGRKAFPIVITKGNVTSVTLPRTVVTLRLPTLKFVI